LTPFEATEKKIVKFLEISDSKLKLKINDKLYVSNPRPITHYRKRKKKVWTKKGLWYEEIFKNSVFWEGKRNSIFQTKVRKWFLADRRQRL
jgi:hypothetical protein